MKVCSKCGVEKPASEFYKDKRHTDGLYSSCKACFRATDKASYQKHRAKRVARHRAYREANPERVKAARAKWAAANPDNLKQRKKRYRKRHKAKLAAEWAEYYEKHREDLLEAQRRRRAVQGRNDYDRAKGAEYARQRRARLIEAFVAPVDETEIIIRDRGICGICGEPADGPIELDHVVPLSRGGTHEPDNVQLAHRLCNRRKAAQLELPLDG